MKEDRVESKKPLMTEAVNIAAKQVAEKIAEIIAAPVTPGDLETDKQPLMTEAANIAAKQVAKKITEILAPPPPL